MTEDELYHYGIKGMKWGVRRFQDESGGLTSAGKKRYSEKRSERKAAREEKKQTKRDATADKYNTRADQYQKRIDELKTQRKTANHFQKTLIDSDIKELETQRDKNRADAEAAKQGKMTRKQKAIAIGVSVVAAYATYKMVDSGAARQLIIKGKAALGKGDLKFKKNPDLAKAMSEDDILNNVVSRINPDYGAPGTKMNCRRCTMAYEMSRRGYDVKATKSMSGTGQTMQGLHNATSKKAFYGGKWPFLIYAQYKENKGEWDSYSKVKDYVAFNKVKFDPSDNPNNNANRLFSELKKQPNGARGEVMLGWRFGGGHSIAYEIVNKEPVFFDCQSGKKYDFFDFADDIVPNLSMFGYSRLDNIDLNEDFLLRWVKNA